LSARLLARLSAHERLNFLLTNRLPRRLATRFMGWFSRIEQPLVRDLSITVWRRFADDLQLWEARKRRFSSLHDCFVRELRAGARPVDPDPRTVVSPCDGVLGAHGAVAGTEVFQAKGFPYALEELVPDAGLVERLRDGCFATLRIKSSMYHRFHAPAACRLRGVVYVSGDTWNVNPIALRRVERLFCRNERAVLALETADPHEALVMVPVAAILVAGIRLHCLGESLCLGYRGPNRIACDAAFDKGEEMGYFHHGSTILVFANRRFRLHERLAEGLVVRAGEPLLRREPA